MKQYRFLFFALFLLNIRCRHEPLHDFPDARYGCLAQYLSPVTPMRDTSYHCCNCVWDWEELISSAIPYDYLNPCFNPDNNNQLAYYRVDNTMPGFQRYELWVDDFCTKEKKLIATNALYSITWGKNNWILYTGIDQNLYKVKCNGDSLTQVTNAPAGSYKKFPKFNPIGDKVLYQGDLFGQNNLFIIDLDKHGSTDTILTEESLLGIIAWDWVTDTTICYVVWSPTIQISLYNTESRGKTVLNEFMIQHSTDSIISSVAPLRAENSIIWCGPGVVGKTNIATKHSEVLIKRFPEEFFLDISVLQNGTDFLLNKRVRHQIDNCTVDSNFDFYLVNSSGTKFNKLNLLE